jgi:hypothetical protein
MVCLVDQACNIAGAKWHATCALPGWHPVHVPLAALHTHTACKSHCVTSLSKPVQLYTSPTIQTQTSSTAAVFN